VFGVPLLDPSTYLTTAGLLATVALIAMAAPARLAGNIDPSSSQASLCKARWQAVNLLRVCRPTSANWFTFGGRRWSSFCSGNWPLRNNRRMVFLPMRMARAMATCDWPELNILTTCS
jgi:hypothetical protein